MVWRWVRLFNDGRENVRVDPRSGRPSVVNEDLVRAVEEKIREQTIHHYATFPAFSSNFTVTSPQNCVWGQRSRYHLLCIAGGTIIRWRDTKTGVTPWQVPQQRWKLCRKVVYSMYIKWQYTWLAIYSCFFLNSPSELIFWITYVHAIYICCYAALLATL